MKKPLKSTGGSGISKCSFSEFRKDLKKYMDILKEGKPVQVKNLILLGRFPADLSKEELEAIMSLV
jgi:hypothetical protein